ncbi:MAG: T9SS type A sorting domain-containing protein, partial [Bacteroidales bacterium]|nr:T9SS type A sorting domain-containing protein [Bacteroidales bacterium]MDD3860120.1 T9SS type A sorting domain-containing protein [Bacteroidales bacterium]
EITDSITEGSDYNDFGFNLPVFTESGTYDYTLNLSNIYGCDSTVFLQLIVNQAPEDSVPEPSGDFNFVIFPIPATEELIIKSDTEVTYSVDYIIYDLFGKKIKTGKIINSETIINLNSLAAGIYFIKIIYNADKNSVLKFLIN